MKAPSQLAARLVLGDMTRAASALRDLTVQSGDIPANDEWSWGEGSQWVTGCCGLQAEKSSKLVAGEHTGLHQERLITWYAMQRKLRARGPEQKGVWHPPWNGSCG